MKVEDMNKSELESLIKSLEKSWAEYHKDHTKGMPDMMLLTKARIQYKSLSSNMIEGKK